MLDSTAPPVVAETGQQLVGATPQRGVKRGLFVTLILTIACPWVPAAQVASAVGASYVLALVSFAGLYVAGAVAYWLAANADHTFVEGTSVLSAYAAQTVTFVSGPLVALIVAFYKYANARWSSGMGTLVTSVGELHQEVDATMHVSDASTAFIGLDLLLNVALGVAVLYLYKALDRRIKMNGDSEDGSSCTTTLSVVCCAACSLFELVWIAKEAAKSPPFSIGAMDELPAFDSGVQATADKAVAHASAATACPA